MTLPTPARAPEKYDFTKPRRLTRERMRTMGAIHERVIRGFEGWLYTRVRGKIEMEFPQVDVLSFGDFAASLPTPCAAYTFEILGTGSQNGIVEIGAGFASLLVDRFFGGVGDPVQMERSLTPIERLAVRLVVERLLSLLAESWHDYVPMEFALRGFESMPVMVRGMAKEDATLVSVLAVVVDGHASEVRICIPLGVFGDFFSTRELRRATDMRGTDEERVAARHVVESSLRAAPVDVTARLPLFQSPIRELLALGVGSVLTTGIAITELLEVHVGDQNRFHAVPGRIGPRLAVRLTDSPPSPLVHADL